MQLSMTPVDSFGTVDVSLDDLGDIEIAFVGHSYTEPGAIGTAHWADIYAAKSLTRRECKALRKALRKAERASAYYERISG